MLRNLNKFIPLVTLAVLSAHCAQKSTSSPAPATEKVADPAPAPAPTAAAAAPAAVAPVVAQTADSLQQWPANSAVNWQLSLNQTKVINMVAGLALQSNAAWTATVTSFSKGNAASIGQANVIVKNTSSISSDISSMLAPNSVGNLGYKLLRVQDNGQNVRYAMQPIKEDAGIYTTVVDMERSPQNICTVNYKSTNYWTKKVTQLQFVQLCQ